MVAGSVTVGGYHVWQPITATSPPTTGVGHYLQYTYPRGQARLSTTFAIWPKPSGTARFGWVVFGDNLYAHHYWLTPDGAKDPARPAKYTKVGAGWTRFTAVEVSSYYRGQTLARQTAYGLRNDGTLLRWSISSTGRWTQTGSAKGFAGVKSISLISRTATYETFVANLRGGGLYTIHLPVAAPMKPVVKQVRATGWARFAKLVASRCGKGSLLIGVDPSTRLGHMYAVGHATGTSTPIQSLGQVNGGMFQTPDPVFFRWVGNPPTDALAGE